MVLTLIGAQVKGAVWVCGRWRLLLIAIVLRSPRYVKVALYLWRRKHFRSYQAVTLLGMWIIPVLLSARLGFVRMLFTWAVFTLLTLYVSFRATRNPLPPETPR